MRVYRLVNFNGKMVKTLGTVIGSAQPADYKECNLDRNREYHLVDFTHEKCEYRGFWPKD